MEHEKILYVEKCLKDASSVTPTATLTLPFELRQKSRQRVQLDEGAEVGLFLPRSLILQDGDVLEAENGLLIAVKAAPELISIARTQNVLLLLRACYHLGNRHVPIQIAANHVIYRHDPALDELMHGFGLTVTRETAKFEPEAQVEQPGESRLSEHVTRAGTPR